MNTSLTKTTTIEIVESGAISTEEFENVGYYIRKSLGHAAVFTLTQVFTLIAFYMFMSEKKIWFISTCSGGFGLLMCVVSEVIQFIVPSRNGAFKDMLIDFGGVVIGLIIAVGIVYLIKRNVTKKGAQK